MKKVFSLVMSFAILFSLSACGNGGAGGGARTSPTLRTDNSSPAPTEAEDVPSITPTQNPEATQEPETESDKTASKSLVVYFSCTGNTKAVADKIAELTGSDIYELVPAVAYTDEDLNYNNDNCRANREMNDATARPAMIGERLEISSYDTIFIGYPIWWGTMPRIVNTFLDAYDLSGKTVMPFCTSGGSGVSRSVLDIKSEEPNAAVKDGLRASGASDGSISRWLRENGLAQ